MALDKFALLELTEALNSSEQGCLRGSREGPSAPEVPRPYRMRGTYAAGAPELVLQLIDRLADYRAIVEPSPSFRTPTCAWSARRTSSRPFPMAFNEFDLQRPLTFVSGPSATSDIELDRVEGGTVPAHS